MNARTKKICDKCNKEISVSNFSKHYNSCKGIVEDIKLSWKQDDMYKCPHCNVLFTERGIKFHIWACHSDSQWHPNKGKESHKKGTKIGPRSLEVRTKISKNNRGAETGGNPKIKWYSIVHNTENIKLRGTYELRFSKILSSIDSLWLRPSITNKHTLKWIDDNDQEHIYIPDFYSPKLDKYFEVKGYQNEKNKSKMKFILSHYNNVEMVFINDLKRYEELYA